MTPFEEVDEVMINYRISVADLETLDDAEVLMYAKGWNDALRVARTSLTSLKYKHEGYPEITI